MKKPSRLSLARKFTSNFPIPMLELFVSDLHIPYHDERAWALVLRLAQELKPDLVFVGGDFLDCYALSRYDKDPRRAFNFPRELRKGRKELRALRSAVGGSARIVFKEGNHEVRLPRYIRAKAPELYPLKELRVNRLLRLWETNTEWLPNEQRHREGKLWHLHGNEVMGVRKPNLAKSMLQKLRENVIFGNYHKTQQHIERTYGGSVQGAWAVGCLCSLDPDYDHFPDWDRSVAVIDHGEDSFQVDAIPLIDFGGKMVCRYRGKEFRE